MCFISVSEIVELCGESNIVYNISVFTSSRNCIIPTMIPSKSLAMFGSLLCLCASIRFIQIAFQLVQLIQLNDPTHKNNVFLIRT